jgi:pyruvate formate lyase activating enzyme
MKEARLYERLDSRKVRCLLCRHGCTIDEGKTGICAVRLNQEGTLYTLVYDKVISTNVDPIEKKPLFHFAPATTSFSIATVGCNFQCSFCQNYSISQMPRDKGTIAGQNIPADRLAAMAVRCGCRSISYTYTEPTIYYELAFDTMRAARTHGLLNVFVTNGYMTREMLDDSRGLIDAANVDLKAFNDRFYTHYCKARREGVMDSLLYMKELGIWLEVTTLLIPGLNDDPTELRDMARFIRENLGPAVPWHISRFYPQYKQQDLPPTDVRELAKARQIGLDEGLYYVYTGNVPSDPGEKTYCPQCAAVLIDRIGYSQHSYEIKDGRCHKCGYVIDGVEL